MIFEIGNRVRHENEQYADVIDIRGEDVLLHWGTEYGVKITSWVKSSEIQLVERP